MQRKKISRTEIDHILQQLKAGAFLPIIQNWLQKWYGYADGQYYKEWNDHRDGDEGRVAVEETEIINYIQSDSARHCKRFLEKYPLED